MVEVAARLLAFCQWRSGRHPPKAKCCSPFGRKISPISERNI